jgi:2-methylisocitrate lyase-like PEP mutase family enzyme
MTDVAAGDPTMAERVERFRGLHRAGAPLVLPNAWDHASGAALARAGFAAIGTTSLGVAAAAGSVDATGATRSTTVHLARRLARDLPLPLNVLAMPELPVARLAELGVRRVSTGSLLFRAALGAALDTARAVAAGTPVPTGLPSYDEAASYAADFG